MNLRGSLLALTLALALVDWTGAGLGWVRMRWWSKPAVLLTITAWFSMEGGWQGASAWFGVGLVFSLAGDIFLLFPQRLFLAGLIAFLAAHLCYIAGLNSSALALQWPALLLLGLGLSASLWIGWRLVRAIRSDPHQHPLLGPVLIYAAVLSLMLFSALLSPYRQGWSTTSAALVIAGASLFFISDSQLAMQRYVRSTRYGDLVVMVTYHLGQFGLAAGALLAFH